MSRKVLSNRDRIAEPTGKTIIDPATIGLLLVSISVVLGVCYLFWHTRLTQLLAVYVSSDNCITQEGCRQLTNAFYFITAALFVIGLGLILARNEVRRIKQVFLVEDICQDLRVWPSPRFVLIASSLVGLFLVVHIRMYDPSSYAFSILYKEDGLFESLTPIVMAFSALLLCHAVLLSKSQGKRILTPSVVAAYLGIALFFFVYAGEEISWGQRIIGWKTPAIFSGNEQNETNFHNYFNWCFVVLYRLPIGLPFLVLFSAWLALKQRSIPFAQAVLPRPSTIGLALIIAFVSLVWFQEQELQEELAAAFAFFYSLRVYGYVRAIGRRMISPG